MVKNVVLGGAGFIGSRLAAKLPDSLSIDRKNGPDEELTMRTWLKIAERIKRARRIWILAADPDPNSDWDSQQRGTVWPATYALRIAWAVKAKEVVYVSSSAVYGETGKRYARETDLPSPVSAYGYAKMAAEETCIQYPPGAKWKVTIIRPGTVVGAQGRGLVWEVAAARGTVKLRGTGEETRTFLHVDDAVDGLVKLAPLGGVWNLSGEALTSLEAAGIAAETAPARTPRIKWRMEKIIPKNCLISSAKLSQAWRPKLTAKEAVKLAAEETRRMLR